jgi:UPF0716 family protein affecting phage T7 exclusion
MARRQGLRAISEVQQELEAGRLPTSSLLDGVMILIAAALLVTPGVLTDAFGFLCLVPAFRSTVKAQLLRRIEKAVREQRVQVHVQGMSFDARDGSVQPPLPFARGDEGPIIDIESSPPSSNDRDDGDGGDDRGEHEVKGRPTR